MYAYLTGNNKLHDVSYNWSHNIKFVTIIFFYLIYNLNFLVPFSLALFYWSIHNLVDEMTGAQQNIIWQMTVALGEAGYGVAWWELQLHAGYYFEIKYECWEFLKNSAKTTTKKAVRQTGHGLFIQTGRRSMPCSGGMQGLWTLSEAAHTIWITGRLKAICHCCKEEMNV